MLQSHGFLVLVVGPSGVGKDTLIGGAKDTLGSDERFSFVRRIVTRPAAIEVEDHESMDLDQFKQMETAGRFALSWAAHDLHYALPLSVEADSASGKVVVANVSRHVLSMACGKYSNCVVVLITAETSRRAERLTRRGRESAGQITARLARESAAVPAGIEPVIIDNSGPVASGVTAFVRALRAVAAQIETL